MTYEVVTIRKRKTVQITHPSDVYELLKNYIRKRQEYFIVLTLDGNHNVVSVRIVSIGLMNKSIVHPREVFIHAIKDNACAIIAAHNHPSNNTVPSDEDLDTTRRLHEAGEIIGIKLIDSIVIGKSGYYSLKQHDEMPGPSDT